MNNEIKFPLKTFFIILLATTLIICYMAIDSNIFIFLSFFIIVLGIIFDKIENKVSYLLFFVSWVYVFKYDITKQSMYSFLVIAFIIVCLISKKFIIDLKLAISFIFLMIYIFIIGITSSEFQIMANLNFICNNCIILIFAALSKNISKGNYKNYFIFYSMGVGSAALVGYIGQNFTQINNFLIGIRIINTVVVDGSIIMRTSGLDIDPNYYALQILMAISVLLIIIKYKRRTKKLEVIFVITLFVFGFLSLSKMYLILIILIIIFYLAIYFKESIFKGIEYVAILFISITIALTFKYNYFYDVYFVRFVGGNIDFSTVTTGRSYIWQNYFNEIVTNIKTLFFGQGISNFLDEIAAHNIFLSTWYKIGLVGIVLYMVYIFICNKSIANKIGDKYKIKAIDIRLLPMYIILIANVALDTSVFSFFPIHILLAILAIHYPDESRN
jgi:hypothetical protein